MAKKKEVTEPQLSSEQTYSQAEMRKVEAEYKREVALVEARPKIRKFGLNLWFAVDVVLLIIFFGYIGFYLTLGTFSERREVASMGDNQAVLNSISQARAAQPLGVEVTRIFTSGEGRYDFLSQIENPNSDWVATFNYYFSTTQGDTQVQVGFALPGRIEQIAALGQEFATRPGSAELIVEDVAWQRVDAHVVDDPLSWIEERLDFSIDNAVFDTALQLEGTAIARSSFEITNNSPYGYWSPDFYLFLVRGGVVQAINKVSVSGFEGGETRSIDVNWFGATPANAEVQIVPYINVFDPDIFMPPQGEATVDVRDRM